MEKLSRVKKYADLRKSIETDNNIDKSLHAAPSQVPEEALQKFDTSVFKKVEIQKEEAYTPKREQIIDEQEEPAGKPVVDDTFTNEYLDDFIREVREYNIRKGNRETENTQADILYQLNAANRAKRSQYVQEIQDEEAENRKSVVSKDDIALQVQNLLKEETLEEEAVPAFVEVQPQDEEPAPQPFIEETVEIAAKMEPAVEEEKVDKQPEEVAIVQEESNGKARKKVLQPLMMEDLEDTQEDIPAAPSKEPDVINKKLLEETQQLRVQMDEYEGELNELSGGMEKTNKLLNFVLCFLILVLLVIIGFIGYSLWKAGGI